MRFPEPLRLCLLGAGLLLSSLSLAQTAPPAGCEPVVARLIAVEGTLILRRGGARRAGAVRLDDVFCTGDVLEVAPFSRAALQLPDQTVVRLDQDTVVSFATPRDDRRTWLDILRGALQVISRDPRALRVITPFANAGIEGTEFYVGVTADATTVIVYEGRVRVENPQGAAVAGSGESVRARAGTAPVLEQVVRPRDAVAWTLYYPPVAAGPLPDADEPAAGRDAAFLVGRAERRLGLGRVVEAESDLAAALAVAPGDPDVLARQAVIALTRNEQDKATALADQAVTAAPANPAGRLAQSYVRQSAGDLAGAIGSLEAATAASPDNALVRARLAELRLGSGDISASEQAARAALALDPALGLPRTVLGFVALARVQLAEARSQFESAIRLEPSAPLPRLGLGLARIRGGELAAGRAEIETAVILDPGSAIVRSYMGKAYYEEKRDGLAASQYALAKDLDSNDPTPWFYDAIHRQTGNDPVGALRNLLAAIGRNGNRAVYRSQLLLDQDLAARSASQGRIYRDLGFDELALRQGWASVATAPADFSGHRLLADSYASLPRHEIARVNELLQSQLLQPLNMTPVQPQLGEANLFILDSAGPSSVAFNEFNPLFNRNGLRVQGSGVVGGNDTWGQDVVVSGIQDRWSFSLGQYHFETEGFRENNDLEQDVLNALVQFQATERTSLLIEARRSERDQGDLTLLFDPDNYLPDLRQREDSDSLKLGLRHDLSARSTILALASAQSTDLFSGLPPFLSSDVEIDSYSGELQYLYQGDRWSLVTGIRYSRQDTDEQTVISFPIPDPPFIIEDRVSDAYDADFLAAYLYGRIALTEQLDVTLGVAAESLEGLSVDKDRVNPKFGLVWRPADGTTVRLAAVETLQRRRFSRQDIQPSLEPTPVAGFNQFFDGIEGEEGRRYGLGVDQVLARDLSVGAEVSRRELKIPFDVFLPPPDFGISREEADVDEDAGRVYLYWTPSRRLALSAEYQYDELRNDADFTPRGYIEIKTHRVPVQLRLFSPSGLSAGVGATWVDQDGLFAPPVDFLPAFRDGDDFVVVDGFLGYRFRNRRGAVRLEARNLFDKDIRFQDVDPENPRIFPERLVLLRLELSL